VTEGRVPNANHLSAYQRRQEIILARFHFLEDDENHVKGLIAKHPLDEAMSLAVAGNWDGGGNLGSDLLIHCGLRDGMTVLDFGCGSGRIASHLSKKSKSILSSELMSLLNYWITLKQYVRQVTFFLSIIL